MSATFLERFDIVEGFPVVDMQTAANNGDYVFCGNAKRVVIVFISGIGTAGDDPTLTVQQATSNAGGGVKALNIPSTASLKNWKKQAATSLASTPQWANAVAGIQASPNAHTWTNTDSAEQSLLLVVEIVPVEDMDVAGGFDYLRATVADIGGNAQPGYLCYIVEKMDQTQPSAQPSNL